MAVLEVDNLFRRGREGMKGGILNFGALAETFTTFEVEGTLKC